MRASNLAWLRREHDARCHPRGRFAEPAGRCPGPARPPLRRPLPGRVGAHPRHQGERPGRLRDGRLRDRRRPRARRVREPDDPALHDRSRLQPRALDLPRADGPLRELLGQHRGDARRIRGRRCGGREARRHDDGRGPGRRGARGERADHPHPRGAPAPSGGRLHVRRRGRGRHARRRRARDPHRDRRRRSRICAPAATRWSSARASSPTSLDGSFPVIYGSDLTSSVAYRWKTQINENAKIPAFAHSLPEMDHNEIVGWDTGGGSSSSRPSSSTTSTSIRARVSASS